MSINYVGNIDCSSNGSRRFLFQYYYIIPIEPLCNPHEPIGNVDCSSPTLDPKPHITHYSSFHFLFHYPHIALTLPKPYPYNIPI